ncbi:GGDEF domain-containing protein [Pseudoduganella sp. LjRoot289]|uniref:GGDEF domain-containing protein n=1 Tax=Pseudoduganella sp. LjRoot289 TaxID=3342314 RepID=UPI003ECF5780
MNPWPAQAFQLDLRTLLLMTTVMSGVMSVVMYSVHRSFRGEVRGLERWSLALACLVLAGGIFTLRGWLTDGIALLGANALLFAGVGLTMIGTQEFFGRRPSWRLFHGVCAVGIVLTAWWQLVQPHFGLRVAVFSFAAFIFYAVQVWLAWLHGVRHFSNCFFGVLVTVQALVVLVRATIAMSIDAGTEDVLRNGSMVNLFLALANFMSLMLAIAFIMMAMRRLQTILEERSTHDPLTGVLNRRGFDIFYNKQRVQLGREGRPLSLMSIDLDHFKAINDRYGHVVGDRVLVQIAHVISQALRESDYVARFGGEEFVVLLPDAEVPRAMLVADRIREALRHGWDDQLPPCTVSIGIGTHVSRQESLDSLIGRTDAALYRAKENGRDRVELAGTAELA